jgi:hypothetical protein
MDWTRAQRAAKGLGAILVAAVLAACGGGGSSGGEGDLRVALTDAPSCGYDNVFVTVERVRVHVAESAGDDGAGWQELAVSPARRIDLLNLTNGVLEELGTARLPAGLYTQLRLALASNTGANPLANAVKPTGGALVALNTPSAQQSGLKLKANILVRPNQTADIVLDFDACHSVVRAGGSGGYNLKPVLSILPRVAGSVQGFVTTTVSLGSTTVSLQQNGATVRSTVPDSSGRFVLPFLQDGSYTLVVTSEGRSTMVVTNVPVAAASGTTAVNTSAAALVPPVSAMSDVSGTTTVAISGALVTDATVAASQTLSGGPTVLIASKPVDADLATYTLRLPVAAPQKASYNVVGLTFAADAGAAGRYALRGTAPGRNAVQQAVDVSGGGNATVNLQFSP